MNSSPGASHVVPKGLRAGVERREAAGTALAPNLGIKVTGVTP
jgi:hypothetical protein